VTTETPSPYSVNAQMCKEFTIFHMKEHSLWSRFSAIIAVQISSNKVWVGTAATRGSRRQGTTNFDINIHDKTLYILKVELEKIYRGKGYGEELYLVLEKVARDLGCTSIRQTPSGQTFGGKSRREYLLERGWKPEGDEVVKTLDGSTIGSASDC
jgi:GNAT superfamily N-acetyltransferase